MNPHELRAALELIPSGSLIPVDWLRSQLEGDDSSAPHGTEEALGDLDVDSVAAIVKRAPSTVRGWLGAKAIPEAYRLQGRDWRVPRVALRRFLDRQKEQKAASPTRARRPNLGEWRKYLKEAP